MLLNLLKRDGSTELVERNIGANLHGLRWTSLVIENSDEAHKLLSEEGQAWWKRVIVHAFVKPKI